MISCGCDFDAWEADAWWYTPTHVSPLGTQRSRKCCGCGHRISVGKMAAKFPRYRPANSDIEERINGDEVAIAPYWMCHDCFSIFLALERVNVCLSLTSDMRSDLEDFHSDFAPIPDFRLKVIPAPVMEVP